jgi:hypothetical protein
MSRNYFVRAEPRTTSGDLESGIAARVSDPLWLLGRQWQLGELLGEDAGSPVSIDLAAETAMISRFVRPGQAASVPYDPAELPLDALTADPMRSEGGWTARLRIDTGRAFLSALADAGVAEYGSAYTEAFRIDAPGAEIRTADPSGARLLDVAAGRIPDGQALYENLAEPVRAETDLPDTPGVPAQDVQVFDAAEAWVRWCDETLVETGGTTWVPEQLAHEFGVATGTGTGATFLDTKDFRGEGLDWHSFDVRPNAQRSGFKALPQVRSLPTGVRFRGMPNPRWWEMEDASVDLGNVDAGPSDVARLALLEFTLVYANDFFAVPLRLPIGSVNRIASLVVADTFGMRLRIRSASQSGPGADRWSMFTLSERDPAGSGAAGTSDLLFLPPVASQAITSEPVEDVLMLRDEMANLAWGVEKRYEGESGAAIERIEEMTRTLPERPVPGEAATPGYVLGTSVPPYWFPLVPSQAAAGPGLKLEQMSNRDASVLPRGRFLDVGGPVIPDAEVPREGTRLVRDYLLTRWSNGQPLLWSRRIRRVGRGEGSSGLRFDLVELVDEETP